MKKIWTIGWKDLLLILHDRGALVLMLGAPFVLTIGLGLVTGAFSDNDSGTGLADIPVAIVNLDEGELGANLETVFYDEEVADLLAPVILSDADAARQQVADDQIAAAVIIPAGFSAGIIPQDMATGQTAVSAPIEVYASPARPISAGVVTSIVEEFVSRVETGLLGINVTMAQLVLSGAVPLQDNAQLQEIGSEIGRAQLAEMEAGPEPIIEVRQETAVADTDPAFNPLAYFAPGMAITFLMYTVALGGRSFLQERDGGTLSRLLVSPSATVQVIGGKVLGIFLSGLAQVTVLVLASTLLFGLNWGDPLGVALLILTVSIAATGWGIFLAAFAKSPGQITTYGTALMLLFGIMGGGLVDLPQEGMMEWFAKLTPNAWALDGFVALHLGSTTGDIVTELLALLAMGAILFAAAVILFRRRTELIVR